MILAHPQISSVLELSGAYVASLVIEAPDFYRSVILDFYEQLNGFPGQWVLSEENVIKPISTHLEFIDNCLQLDMNRKPILNKVYGVLERTALSEGFYLKTTTLLSELEAYMDSLTFTLPCDILCEKSSVNGLIKAMGVSLRDDYEDPLERLLDYMELIREFSQNKLFVIAGLRSLFSDASLAQFLKTVTDHDYRVLLLDCVDKPKLPLERRLTIDKDLCEF